MPDNVVVHTNVMHTGASPSKGLPPAASGGDSPPEKLKFAKIALAVLALALVFMLASVPTHYWYEDGDAKVNAGLFKTCINDRCSTNKNTDTCSGASSCAEWSRLQTARAFSITAIIVTPVAGALIGFRAFDPTSGNPNNGKFGGAVAAIVALFGLIATAAFVGALDAQDVDHDFGWSFALFIVAWLLDIGAAVLGFMS